MRATIFSILLFLTMHFAWGQTTVESLQAGGGFDCWIGTQGTTLNSYVIRCLSTRDIAYASAADNPEFMFIAALYQALISGSSLGAEEAFKKGAATIAGPVAIWHIPIHAYPAPWSWQEHLPEQLVQATLCTRYAECPVTIRH